jgi:DNA-binding MarR family transcriptional regulator
LARHPPDITATLSYRVLLLSNTLARWAAREYPRRFGVSLPEWRVLSIVAARSPVAVNAIAEAISVDKAWVSRTLRRLGRAGFTRARQDPGDERRVFIEITAKGRAKAERMLRASQARQRSLVTDLRPADLARFLGTLAHLQSRAEAMLAADTPPLAVRRRWPEKGGL